MITKCGMRFKVDSFGRGPCGAFKGPAKGQCLNCMDELKGLFSFRLFVVPGCTIIYKTYHFVDTPMVVSRESGE